MSANLIDFSKLFPFHDDDSNWAVTTLKSCIGYDGAYGDFGVAVPIIIPAGFSTDMISSISFTLAVKVYNTREQDSDPEDDWKIWISTERYETGSGKGSAFNKVSAQTPHLTITIPHYKKGSSSDERFITFSISSYNWNAGTTYYAYLWNACSPRKFCMWTVTSWTAYPYCTITYNKGAYGTGANTQYKEILDRKISLEGAMFTRTGYHQIGWAADKDDGQKDYELEDYIIARNVTLYPVWELDTYYIQYHPNGGSGNQSSESKKYNVGFNLPECKFTPPGSSITRYQVTYDAQIGSASKTSETTNAITSYSFKAWRLNSTSGSSYLVGSIYKYNSNATFYAEWQGLRKEAEITLPTVQSIPAGYKFLGWKAGSATYPASTVVTITNDTTFTAVWGIESWYLTYDVNGGDGKNQVQLIPNNTATTLIFTPPTRKGYKFDGWAESPSARVGSYKANSTITITGTTTLYAVWKPLSFKVTYVLNGGTSEGSIGPVVSTVLFDSMFTLLTNVIKPSDYLIGWTTNKDGTDDGYNWGSHTGIWKYIEGERGIRNGTLTLYAIWNRSPFRLTYSVSGAKYTHNENVPYNSTFLSITDVLEKDSIPASLPFYHRFVCWGSVNSDLLFTPDELWTYIDRNAPRDQTPRPFEIEAKLSPRYKIVYYDGSSYKQLIPVVYKNNKFTNLTLAIKN